MPRKTYGPEQIIGMLREADVALGQGSTVGEMPPCPGHCRAQEYRACLQSASLRRRNSQSE